MSRSRYTPKKYNGTDLKHRQRLLMLADLCIGADLLAAWLLPGGKPFLLPSGGKRGLLVLGVVALVLAFVSRSDPREEMNGNGRIAAVGSLFLAVIVFLTLHWRFFWIVGLVQLLALAVFAAWPYRRRIFLKRKTRK